MANGVHGRYAHRDRRRPNPPQEIRPPDTRQTGETRPIPQTREECIRPTSHRIPRCRPRRQHDPNGSHKNQGSSGVATTKKSNRCPLLPGIYGVLSVLHPKLFESRTPSAGSNEESNPLDMDNGPDNSIQNAEEVNVLETRLDPTTIRQAIHSTHRRISIWRGRNTLARGRSQPSKTLKATPAPHRLLLSNVHTDGKELRHLRERTFGCPESPTKLETTP